MPQTVEQPAKAERAAPRRYRLTRPGCDLLRDAGLLTGRYELIDGEILEKMGQNPAHAFVIRRLMGWLNDAFGQEFVLIQLTIDVSRVSPLYDEPEPDAAVTSLPVEAYAQRHPTADEIVLLVEISDTSLRFDRTVKAELYARAGIQDYWVVDVQGRRLFVHRQPSSPGYQQVTVYGETEEVTALARPEATLTVSELLPRITSA